MKDKVNREKIPQPGQPRPFNFPEFRAYRLPEGLQTITVHKNNLPLVNLLYHVSFSPLDDRPGHEGQASLLSLLLLEGTKKLTGAQIAGRFEALGANYNTHIGWSGFYFELNILKEHLEKGLELSRQILYESVLPDHEFARLKQEALVDRLQIKDMAGRIANERLLKLLFPDHRYGLPVEGLSASIEKITVEELRSLYNQVFLKRQPTIIFTGNIEEDEALSLTEKYFASQQNKAPHEAKVARFEQSAKPKMALVHKPNAAQIELRVAQFIPPRQHPDFFKIRLMNEIFGGYFLSRLNLNLREKHGYTYGIHSQLTYRPQVGMLLISASIQSEFITQALQEVFKETHKMKEEGVSADELSSAAGYLIGVFPTAFETIDQISDAIAHIVTYNLPADYYRTFREKIAEVTVEQVNEAAQKYLKPQNMQVVLVGDRNVVEKALKENYEIEVFDIKGNPLK
ncbi:M16 family metallopeptidase [Caldithrix abyssi]